MTSRIIHAVTPRDIGNHVTILSLSLFCSPSLVTSKRDREGENSVTEREMIQDRTGERTQYEMDAEGSNRMDG